MKDSHGFEKGQPSSHFEFDEEFDEGQPWI
jgi:hypothetical protein